MTELHVCGGPRDGEVIAVPGDKPPLDYVFPVLTTMYYTDGTLPPPSAVHRRVCPIRLQRLFIPLPAGASIEHFRYAIDWYGGEEK